MPDWCWLLANVELGQAFSRYARRSMSLTENWTVVAVFVVIPLSWIALFYWDRYRKQNVHDRTSSKGLFLELCRAHKLSRSDRSFLLNVAKSQGLEQPAVVFVDSRILSTFQQAQQGECGRCGKLLARLFAESRAV